MTDTLLLFLLATAFFIVTHSGPSIPIIRRMLVDRLGLHGYLALYSVLATVALVWLVQAYRAAPYAPLWFQDPWTRWVPFLLVPLSLFFLVTGLTTRIPVERWPDAPEDLAPGVYSLTRQPLMVATILWSLAHLPPNGDLAAVILFGSFIGIGFAGMANLDLRRRARGEAWQAFEDRTSRMPFAAALAGRTKLDLAGVTVGQLVWTVLLYGALLYGHEWFAGIPIVF